MPPIKIGNVAIRQEASARYLGVEIDGTGRYKYHADKAVERTGPLIAGMARIMPRVRGAGDGARRLYVTACLASLLYGVPVWEGALKSPARFRMVAACVRQVLIRAVRACGTASGEALHVLAGVPPLDLLVAERSAMFREGRALDRGARSKFATALRQHTISKWQERWDASSMGRVTHSAIPRVNEWVNRKSGSLTYFLTQALTGHGSFRRHRFRFGKEETDLCWCGSGEQDVPEHDLARCAGWAQERRELANRLRAVSLTPATTLEQMTADMLDCEEGWEAYAAYWERVLRSKDRDLTRK